MAKQKSKTPETKTPQVRTPSPESAAWTVADLITVAEARKIVGVNKTRLFALIDDNRLAFARPGNELLLHRGQVEQFAALPRQPGNPNLRAHGSLRPRKIRSGKTKTAKKTAVRG